ncbi:DNA replication factor Cdt1 [Diorhabda sublineata]|uniref:DNA replication factor Cdt1 n=1 Tax=Diorhabda sublineata TaxID=1163346 RepID=UPI0024E130B6|nr:DNA replication factor Cdt1 [Diorhabda sublineata]
MAQPSVACFFNARKRSAAEDIKINRAKKVLLLDNEDSCGELAENDKINVVNAESVIKDVLCLQQSNELQEKEKNYQSNKIVNNRIANRVQNKKVIAVRNKNLKSTCKQPDIQNFFNKMKNDSNKVIETTVTAINEEKSHVTPPRTPTKNINALDKVGEKPEGPSLKEIKRKLTRSARLAELKASISRFQENSNKLKDIEKKTSQIPESPKLKTFKTIELEVESSPQKVFSPEKQYLSPKKDLGARRNLFNLQSPTKNAVSLWTESYAKQILEDTSKPSLTLPYKYRYIAEMFRSIDVVCQIMFNRKETITFRKLKPAVEEMMKRNLLEKHLAQIKEVYPGAFKISQEKLKVFGTGMKTEQWELLVVPNIGNVDHMTSEILLQRRRTLFNILINKVKHYHEEFLLSLVPPMVVNKNNISRWHPAFDIEKVPDIECSPLPQPPVEDKLSTGKDVLDKAMQMFNCNSRMEQALKKLKEMKNAQTNTEEKKEEVLPASVLKGIPKALLEKVRQKQAAKALLSMTRSEDKEKELKTYSRLPELARLTRNVFVSEKKSVLPLDVVVDKLGNCYRSHLTKVEMEEHLRIISKEFPSWLVFHVVRNAVYLKISKSDDLSLIIQKLEDLVKQKSEI